LRRRKEEVLSELPPKRRTIQEVAKNDNLYIKLITKSVELAEQIPLAPDMDKSMLLLMAVENSRKATGIAKSQHVAEFVKLILETGEPCLLFAYHHDVMALYEKYLKKFNPLFITGLENKEQKQENIDYFMNGHTNLLIINLRTTAGLNLQRARCVIFGELDWSPAVHTQAEDRVHRIGQKDSVLAYYLVTDTISDIEISACLKLKQQQFTGLMLDKKETESEKYISQVEAQKFMWNIVNKLRKKEEN